MRMGLDVLLAALIVHYSGLVQTLELAARRWVELFEIFRILRQG